MAQTNFTPILLYASSTAAAVPLAANLTNSATGSEIAINIADKNLFFKDSTNAVNTVPIRQSSTSSNGWLSSTDWSTFNGKQAALVSGTTIKTVSGVSLLGSGDVGTIGVAYGGTGLTSLTTSYIPYGNGTSAFSSSSTLTYNGTSLTAGNFIPSSSTVPTNGLFLAFTNVIGWSTNSTERARISATGVFYVGGNTSRNNELFNVNGTGVTQAFSSNGNATLNTVIDSSGAGGGLCIIRGVDGFTGQSFSRVYVVSITVLGGAASTLATLIGSAGGAGTTGFTFAFAGAGGFVTVTAAGFSAFGGAWNVSFVGL
jgi:hypothetical protein